MKITKILWICAMAITLTACGGEDEPTPGGEYGNDTPFPTLSSSHKRIKELSRTLSNNTVQTAIATYDSRNHLTRIKLTTNSQWLKSEETVSIDYSARTVTQKQTSGSYTYDFELDANGRITKFIGRSASRPTYTFTYDNGLLLSTSVTSTEHTDLTWFDNNVTRSKYNSIDITRDYGYIYGNDDGKIANKGNLDLATNVQTPFNVLVNTLMRSEGMLGEVSVNLPLSVSCKTQYTGMDPNSRSTPMTYTFSSDGYVTGFTGYDFVNDLSFTATVTYDN